ncbi:hypothetical protein B5S31_g1496 [[Candida] boidinii]|nr:hypothetical protein B5S31_g1496 [[Candida] boidinii]OWB79541.1 hypothetical protein B5S32_g3765 [[Candida] boidinii]
MTLASSPTKSDYHSDYDDYDPIVEEVSNIESFDNFRNNFISNVDTEDETEKEDEEEVEDYDIINNNAKTDKILKNSEKKITKTAPTDIVSNKISETETEKEAEIEVGKEKTPVLTQDITDSETDQDKTPEIKQDKIPAIEKKINYYNNNDSIISDSIKEKEKEKEKEILKKIDQSEEYQEDSTFEIIYPKPDQKDTKTLEIKDQPILSDSIIQEDSLNKTLEFDESHFEDAIEPTNNSTNNSIKTRTKKIPILNNNSINIDNKDIEIENIDIDLLNKIMNTAHENDSFSFELNTDSSKDLIRASKTTTDSNSAPVSNSADATIDTSNDEDYQDIEDEQEEVSETATAPTTAPTTSAMKISRTYSSDLISNFDDLDLEYETFNGSVTDVVTKTGNNNRKDYLSRSDDDIEDEEVFKTSNKSLESITRDTTLESNDDSITNDENDVSNMTMKENDKSTTQSSSPLKGKKDVLNNNTNVNDSPVINDFEKLRKFSPHFTIKKTSSKIEMDTKVNEMTRQFNDLDHKIFKIERELNFLEDIIPKNISESRQSIEIKKLIFARSKLFERYESLKKERYMLSIKLNTRWKKLYGNDGEKTQFWIRNVTN